MDGIELDDVTDRLVDDCFASLADNGIMVVNLWGCNLNYNEYLVRIHNSFADSVVVVSIYRVCTIAFHHTKSC